MVNSLTKKTFFQSKIIPILKNSFKNCYIINTHSKEEAKLFLQNNLNSFDVFVACGGDGTIQLLAKELAYSDKILGILPCGSGNDFSKLLGNPNTINTFIDRQNPMI